MRFFLIPQSAKIIQMEEPIIKYPFPVKQQVQWGEMDAFNHVNNVTFFRYFETGRVNFLFESGLWQLLTEEGVKIVVAKLECNFAQPLFYPETIEIAAGIKKIGTTSIIVHQRIIHAERGIIAHGDAVIVGTDAATDSKLPWSNILRAAFEKWM